MKYVPCLTGRAVSSLLAACFVSFFATAKAEVQSGQVLVQAVHGSATYFRGDANGQAVKENLILTRGTTLKTAKDTTVDLILQYNGTVLRLMPESTLSFEKLNKEDGGEGTITETSLKLTAGSILGSQRKLASPSSFQINVAGGVAYIKGTEYQVHSDGAVTVLSGSVKVIYNLPHNGGSVQVTVPAGYTFNPTTGKVVTTPDLSPVIADINAVRENAKVFKTGGATIVVKPKNVLSPTKGNNGVGNGQDGQPPGNPPINDGPGTGPGNPGNRHHGNANANPRKAQNP